MDAFFTSVEQRDNPELRDKPVAVGSADKRGVVAAASYEARKFGVYSAMPSVTAKRKCPELIFVPHRFDVYQQVSKQIHAIFNEYTDLIEPLSLDEAYLDVTKNKKGYSSATQIAQEIKDKIKQRTQLTASAGVSVNKFLAKIASDEDKPDGLFVITPDKVQAFIDDLAIEKFYGVGKVTAKKMKALGILKGLDLKQWSEADLVAKFGKAGHYFYGVSHGKDDRSVQASTIRKSIGAEHTFSEDKTHLEDLQEVLHEITEEVVRRVNKRATQGRTVTLKIKFADFTQITRSFSFSQAIDDYDSIYSSVDRMIRDVFRPGMSIRLLGITLSNLGEEKYSARQLTLKL